MDLKSYLVSLKGKIRVILLTAIVTVVVVTLITFLIPSTYTASTTLRVAMASTGSIEYSDYMYADRLMNTYTRLATSGPVLQELASSLNLQTIPEIKVEPIPNTELIKISVDSTSPEIAQKSADSLAEILIAQGKQLYSGGGKSTQEILGEQVDQVEQELTQARQEYDAYIAQTPTEPERVQALSDAMKLKEQTYMTLLDAYDQARLREMTRANIITVVEPAVLPLTPSKPSKALNIGLGLIIGIAGGIGLAFLIDNLGSTRSPHLVTN